MGEIDFDQLSETLKQYGATTEQIREYANYLGEQGAKLTKTIQTWEKGDDGKLTSKDITLKQDSVEALEMDV